MKHSTIIKIITLNLFLFLSAKAENIVTYIDVASANAWSQSSPSMELGDTLFISIHDGDYNFILNTIPSGAAIYSTPTGSPQNVGYFHYVPTVTGNYTYSSAYSGAAGSFTVNPATPSIATGVVSNLAVCSGNSLTIPFTYRSTISGFSAQLSDANGGFTSPTALSSTTVTSSFLTVNIPSGIATGTGYRVRVVSTSPNTTGSANLQNISINLSTTATPEVKVNITPQGAICPGTVVTHTGSSIGLAGATYDWYVNNTLASGNINPFVKSNFLNNDRAYVIVTGTAGGCTPTPYSTTIVGNVMTVSSSIVPTLSISASPNTAICFGTDVTITGIPSGGGASPAYQLSLTGVYTSSTTIGSNFIVKGAKNGLTASLVMTSNLSCISGVKATSNILTINTIPSNPTIAGISCTGTSCLKSLAITSLTGASYQWYKSNVAVDGAINSLFTPTITGSYKVSISNGLCSYTSLGFNITVTSLPTTTGIADEIESDISIYPNPVESKLTIAIGKSLKNGALSVKIYDLNQKLVLTQALGSTSINGIDVSSLISGLYIVQIIDGNAILKSSKLIKQ